MKDSRSVAGQKARRRVVLVSALTLTVGLAACGDGGEDDGDAADGGADTDGAGGQEAGETHEWDYYIFVPTSHPAGQAQEEFAEAVTEATGGEVTVTVRPVGEIPIKPNEALQALRSGEIQLADAYVGFITGDTTFSGVLGLPFLATTNEEGNEAVAALQEEIDQEFSEFGAELLFTYDWNMQVIHGKGEPVTAPGDLAGLKARASSPQQSEFLERMGAFPTTLTSEEVPSAMNTGVINAVLTAPMNIVGSGWDDFIDWSYLAGVNPGISFVVVSEEALNGVSEESQQAIRDLAEEYNTSVSEGLYGENDTALATLKDADKTITEPKDEHIEELREEMRPYWEDWAAENGAEDMLQRVTDALGL